MRSLFPQSLQNLFLEMKRTLLVLLIIILLSSCKTSRDDTDQIEEFYADFNQEQKEAFELAVESFERFLELNFQAKKREAENLMIFLAQITDSAAKAEWKLENEKIREVLRQFEDSGLRKEIWLYGFEKESEMNEVIYLFGDKAGLVQSGDSLKSFNAFGAYLQGLLNIRKPSQLVIDYAEAKYVAGTFSTELMAEVLLSFLKEDLNEIEILKRIIIAEFYFGLLQLHVTRNIYI
jgi:Tfp pilus assembly protein PilP